MSRVAVEPGAGSPEAALGEARRRRGGRRRRRPSAARCPGARPWRRRRCPSGRRSRREAAGRSSSARRRAQRQGGRGPGAPPRSRAASGTVHQTAVVRSARTGRSRGSSPSTSPPGWRRLRNETTWWLTSTSPKRQPAVAPARVLALLDDRDVGDLARRRRVVRLGALDHCDVVLEVEGVAPARSRPGGRRPRRRGRCRGRSRRRRCRPPARSRPRPAGPARRPSNGCRRGRRPGADRSRTSRAGAGAAARRR